VTDEASEHGVHDVENNCDETQSPTILSSGSSANIANGVTYQLDMDCTTWLCIFDITFPSNGYYAFFSEHDPSEFYNSGGTELAMLKDIESHDVSPDFVVGSNSSEDQYKWRDTMLGCLAVWGASFFGLILLINADVWNLVKPYACMFASGTLLSVAFCLVLYESNHLITDETSTESLAAGSWSAMILIGFISSPIIRMLMQLGFKDQVHVHGKHDYEHNNEMVTVATVENEVVANTECGKEHSHSDVDVTLGKEREISIIWSMMIADFLHNFSDGIFIGSSFLCSSNFAWKIVAITVAHELPQELSDFSILTSKLNYSVPTALLYNFLCGVSVMLGGIAVVSADIALYDVGMILAYGAGNYIYIATVHLFEEVKDMKDMAIRVLWFCLGAVSIGLILLNHTHCEPSSASDGGHDH